MDLALAQAKTDMERFRAREQDNAISQRVRPQLARAREEMAAFRAEQRAQTITVPVDIDRNAIRNGAKAAGAKAKSDFLSEFNKLNSELGDVFGSLGDIGKLIGISGLIANIPAAVTAVASLGQALGQLSGAALAVPGGIATAVASIGTLAIGLSGISDAYSAVSAASTESTTGMAERARAVASATTSLRNAVVDETQAEKDVTTARRDARQELIDLNLEMRGGVISIKQAENDAAKARRDLAKGGFKDIYERRDAELRVEETVQRVAEAYSRQSELITKKADADAKGVDGSDRVVAANERVIRSQQGVAAAQQSLTDATGTSIAAADKAADALAKLSPQAAAFVNTLVSLKPKWTDLQKTVSGNLFEGASQSFTTFVDKVLPGLKTGLGSIATAWNTNIKNLLGSLGSDNSKGLLDRILGNTAKAQDNFNKAIDPLVRGIGTLTAAGSDAIPRIATAIGDVATRFANFIDAADKDGRLDKWISDGLDGFTNLGNILLNLGKSFFSITDALGGVGGDGLLGSFSKLTEKWAAFLASAKGQQDLKNFFAEGKKEIDELRPIVSDLIKTLPAIWHGAKDAMDVFMPIFREFTSTISDHPRLIRDVVGAFAVWKSISAVTDMVGSLKKMTDLLTNLPSKVKTAAGVADDAANALPGGGGGNGKGPKHARPGKLGGLASALGPLGWAAAASAVTYDAVQDKVDADKSIDEQIAELSKAVPAGLPKPESSEANQALLGFAASNEPGAQWVNAAPSGADGRLERAKRYVFWATHYDPNNPVPFVPPPAGSYETGGPTEAGLAVLHPNEFVLSARASKYPMGFKHALNEGRIDPKMLPHFDNGGPFKAADPSYDWGKGNYKPGGDVQTRWGWSDVNPGADPRGQMLPNTMGPSTGGWQFGGGSGWPPAGTGTPARPMLPHFDNGGPFQPNQLGPTGAPPPGGGLGAAADDLFSGLQGPFARIQAAFSGGGGGGGGTARGGGAPTGLGFGGFSLSPNDSGDGGAQIIPSNPGAHTDYKTAPAPPLAPPKPAPKPIATGVDAPLTGAPPPAPTLPVIDHGITGGAPIGPDPIPSNAPAAATDPAVLPDPAATDVFNPFQQVWQNADGTPKSLGDIAAGLPDKLKPATIAKQFGQIALGFVAGFFGLDTTYLSAGAQAFDFFAGKFGGQGGGGTGGDSSGKDVYDQAVASVDGGVPGATGLLNPASRASTFGGANTTYSPAFLQSKGIAPLYTRSVNAKGENVANIPAWATQLGAKFNLTPTSHVDSTLHGGAGASPGGGWAFDFSGKVEDEQRFADFVKTNLRGQTLQLIWQNPNTGEQDGIAGGQVLGHNEYYTDKGGTYADHTDHVHWATDVQPNLTDPATGKSLLDNPQGGNQLSGANARGSKWFGAPGDLRNRAHQAYLAAGMPPGEWDDFDSLIQHESGWQATIKNPGSTAYGLGQFLDSTWASVGGVKTDDPLTQLGYIFAYLKQRPDYHGSPSAAWSLWQSRTPHWYDQGGILPPGLTLAMNATGQHERILNPAQNRAYEAMLPHFESGGPYALRAVIPPPPRPTLPRGPSAQPKITPAVPTPPRPTAPTVPQQPPAAGPPPPPPDQFAPPPQQPDTTPAPGAVQGPAGASQAGSEGHLLPAIGKAIDSGAATIGALANTAASLGTFGAAGAVGGALGSGGGGGLSIGGVIQQAGKIVKGVAEVGASFLVGNVTPGTIDGKAEGETYRPQQRIPQTAPLNGESPGRNYIFNGIDSRNVVDEMRLKDAQDAQAVLARW